MLEFALWRRAESLVVTRPAVERGEEKRTMAAAGEGGGGMREEERRRGRAAERSAFEEENETRALIFPSAPLRGKKLQFVFLLLLFQTPANPHAAPLGSFLSLSLRMRASLQAPSARYVESRSLFEGDRKDTRMSERERRKKKTPNDDIVRRGCPGCCSPRILLQVLSQRRWDWPNR